VNVAKLLENQYGSAPGPASSGFFNDFVPHGAELVLLSGKSSAYVKIRESPQNTRFPKLKIGAKKLAGDVDEDGK